MLLERLLGGRARASGSPLRVERTVATAGVLCRAGKASYFEVLMAQQNTLSAELGLIQAMRDQHLASVLAPAQGPSHLAQSPRGGQGIANAPRVLPHLFARLTQV